MRDSIDCVEQRVDTLLRHNQIFASRGEEDHGRNAVLRREELLEVHGFLACVTHPQDPHLVGVFLVCKDGQSVRDHSAIADSGANGNADAVPLISAVHQIYEVHVAAHAQPSETHVVGCKLVDFAAAQRDLYQLARIRSGFHPLDALIDSVRSSAWLLEANAVDVDRPLAASSPTVSARTSASCVSPEE